MIPKAIVVRNSYREWGLRKFNLLNLLTMKECCICSMPTKAWSQLCNISTKNRRPEWPYRLKTMQIPNLASNVEQADSEPKVAVWKAILLVVLYPATHRITPAAAFWEAAGVVSKNKDWRLIAGNNQCGCRWPRMKIATQYRNCCAIAYEKGWSWNILTGYSHNGMALVIDWLQPPAKARVTPLSLFLLPY